MKLPPRSRNTRENIVGKRGRFFMNHFTSLSTDIYIYRGISLDNTLLSSSGYEAESIDENLGWNETKNRMELKKYVRKGGNEKERIREGGKKEINNRKEKRRERDRNRVIEQTPEASIRCKSYSWGVSRNNSQLNNISI